MVDLAKLDELIARVEKAEGADRFLDRDIGFALDGWELSGDQPPLIYVPYQVTYYADHPGAMYPSFTEGADNAIGLVERMLPGAQVGLDPIFFVDPEAVRWDAIICIPDMSRWNPVNSNWIRRIEGRHDSRVLAIILALLKALREASYGH